MRTHLTSLALVTVLLLAGCSAGGGDSAGEPATAGDGAVELSGPQAGSGDAGQESVDGAVEDDPSVADDRQFVVTGSIAVVVEDPRQAAGEAATLVEETGGFVQQRTIDAGGKGEPASAFLLVRIPSDEVTPTVLALEALGELDHMTEESVEVTEQVVDLEGRIRAAELAIQQLEEVLATSTSVTEIAQAEDGLAMRRTQLEQLLTEQESVREEIDFATFEVDLWSPGQAPEGPAEPVQGFWPSLVRSWDALVDSLGGVLTVLGAVLPWAAFLGLIGWGATALWRRYQRVVAARPSRRPVPGPYAVRTAPVPFPTYGDFPAGSPSPAPVGEGAAEQHPGEDAVSAGRPPAPPA